MPTPIQHLVIAGDVLTDPALASTVRAHLAAARGAFLFGSIAPDVQSVSKQPREATHFFQMPPTNTQPAPRVMLATHPTLARSHKLPSAQAAFIAGYLAHLALDELWIADVFGPHFGLTAEWGTFRERLLIHNVLRTWLDQRDQNRLNGSLSATLAEVEPRDWLPFVTDEHLRAWRDEIAAELRPGSEIRTAEVFAERLHVPSAEFRRVLESPEEMQRRVFSHLSPGCVDRFYTDARTVSVRWITEYLKGD
jgi:Zinc dependent phospholipase C